MKIIKIEYLWTDKQLRWLSSNEMCVAIFFEDGTQLREYFVKMTGKYDSSFLAFTVSLLTTSSVRIESKEQFHRILQFNK